MKWKREKMNKILATQLSIDFCCTEEMVLSKENIFTEYKAQEGRRIFNESECYLKVASVNGKILASGKKEIITWAEERYKNGSGAWFMDFDNLRELDAKMKEFGCHIGQAHPFYIATEKTIVDTKGYEIKKYVGDEINQFRGDDRFGEAFIFSDLPKDEIGIAAIKDGTVDVISTDHAPHAQQDKAAGSPGFTGLETSFAVCNTVLVKREGLSLCRLSQLMSENPSKLLKLNSGKLAPGYEANLVLVDPDEQWTVCSEKFQSKGKSTPFEGQKLTGRVHTTFYLGNQVYSLD